MAKLTVEGSMIQDATNDHQLTHDVISSHSGVKTASQMGPYGQALGAGLLSQNYNSRVLD